MRINWIWQKKKQYKMKHILIIINLLFIVSQLHGQLIPNGDFEQWHLVEDILTPDYWTSNSKSELIRVIPDTLEGAYGISPQLLPKAQTGWQDCATILSTTLHSVQPDIRGLPLLFSFEYKSIHENDDQQDQNPYLLAKIDVYSAGEVNYKHIWAAPQPALEWTYHNFELPLATNDSIQISFISGSELGADDGCYNHTISFIDNVDLQYNISSISPISSDSIWLNYSSLSGRIIVPFREGYFLHIIDFSGRYIMKEKCDGQELFLPSGDYIAYFSDNNTYFFSKVQRLYIF